MLLSENIFENKSLLFELELEEYFDMITSKHLNNFSLQNKILASRGNKYRLYFVSGGFSF